MALDSIEVVYDLNGGELNTNNLLAGDEVTSRNVDYALVGETGSRIQLNISSLDYKMTAILKDKNNNVIYTSNIIDLPLESMVVNGRYDSTTKKLILTLQNGNTIEFSIADLISGLVSTDQMNSALANKVGFTDYATSSKGGVIKTNYSNSFSTNPSNGIVYCDGKTYEQYQSAGNGMFIGKQTLENVITGKDLTTKSYVDGLVGDINDALQNI